MIDTFAAPVVVMEFKKNNNNNVNIGAYNIYLKKNN